MCLAACHADGPRHDPIEGSGTPPASFDPHMLVAATFDARTTMRAVVAERAAAADHATTVSLALDHELGDVRVLALSDPIGDVTLEVHAGGVDLVEDDVRTALLPVGGAVPARGDGSGSGGPDRTASPVVATSLADRTVAWVDGCAVVTLTRTWPTAGPLDATWRQDTWTLCAPDGLHGRSRSVRFPAGERTIAWER